MIDHVENLIQLRLCDMITITAKDLKKGEVVCNKCHGRGCFDVPESPRLLKQCLKCHGKGKLDWIQNVVGIRLRGR